MPNALYSITFQFVIALKVLPETHSQDASWKLKRQVRHLLLCIAIILKFVILSLVIAFSSHTKTNMLELWFKCSVFERFLRMFTRLPGWSVYRLSSGMRNEYWLSPWQSLYKKEMHRSMHKYLWSECPMHCSKSHTNLFLSHGNVRKCFYFLQLSRYV